jgi:hypothetical protein
VARQDLPSEEPGAQDVTLGPRTRPGVPSRLEGREEIIAFMVVDWMNSPLRYERCRTFAVHDTSDPDTIIVKQEVLGTSASWQKSAR